MEYFENAMRVGEGTYGHVYRCRVRGTSELVAIKRFKAGMDDDATMRTSIRELSLLRTLHHDSIIALLDVFVHDNRWCLVFDYVESTLLEQMERTPGGLSPRTAKRVVWQLLHALDYLHSREVMHRDIKPENILMSKDGIVKLCDFGFARRLEGGGKEDRHHHSSTTAASAPMALRPYTDYVATRWYRAPELLVRSTGGGGGGNRVRRYGPSVDIWALGCVMAEMLTGRPAFPGATDAEQLAMVTACAGPLLSYDDGDDARGAHPLVAPTLSVPSPPPLGTSTTTNTNINAAGPPTSKKSSIAPAAAVTPSLCQV